MQGTYLMINHGWRKLGIKLPAFFGWVITFLAVIFSWVVFRATNINDAVAIWQAMLGIKGIVLVNDFKSVLFWLSGLGVKFESWR